MGDLTLTEGNDKGWLDGDDDLRLSPRYEPDAESGLDAMSLADEREGLSEEREAAQELQQYIELDAYDVVPRIRYEELESTAERYREALERRDELQKALNDPDLLHWLGSQDVLDVSPAVARAVSAIHRLRAALGDGRG